LIVAACCCCCCFSCETLHLHGLSVRCHRAGVAFRLGLAFRLGVENCHGLSVRLVSWHAQTAVQRATVLHECHGRIMIQPFLTLHGELLMLFLCVGVVGVVVVVFVVVVAVVVTVVCCCCSE
jgi:hypothetical protein